MIDENYLYYDTNLLIMFVLDRNPEKKLDFDLDIFNNKNILITGATSGIGKQVALEISKYNANIFIHGRNRSRGESLVEDIEDNGSNAEFFSFDFSEIDNIKEFSDMIKSNIDELDYLVNCAGEFVIENKKSDDYNYTFISNYLSRFIISIKLIPLLKESNNGKIINVSSNIHKNIEFINFDNIKSDINDWNMYSTTMLFNIMFSQKLDTKTSGILVNTVNPGFIIDTRLYRNLQIPFLNYIGRISRYMPIPGVENSKYGASMVLFAMNKKSETPGTYYSNFSIERPSYIAEDTDAQNVLWDISKDISEVNPELYLNEFEFNKVSK